MSDQPAVPALGPDELPDFVHIPEARLRGLDEITQRNVQATVARLLREADRAEGAALAEVFDQLEELQRVVRGTLSTAAEGTPFAVLWNELERRIDETLGQVAGSVSTSLDDAAAAGARLIDEAIRAAGGNPLQAVPDDVTDGIRTAARQAVAEAHQNLKLRTTRQALLLTTGEQDLARTLSRIGDGLRGSQVFGAPSAKVARTVRTEMGEAHGAGLLSRSEKVNAEAVPGAHVARKRWVWSHDTTGGREDHALAERRYAIGGEIGPIPTGERFRVGGFSTPYPRGPGLPGPQKVNCGCRSVPVLMTVETEDAA